MPKLSDFKYTNIYKLRAIVIQAVEYVGYANYQERENHAKQEIDRNFKLYIQRKYSELKFNE